MKLSELYGAEIISKDKKIRGTICGICCAENQIAGYICFDECEKEFFAEAAGSKASRGEVIFEKTGKAQKNYYSVMLGRAAYTTRGKFYGHLEDCTVTAGKITYAKIGGRRLPFARLTFGDVIIIGDGADTSAELAAKNMFISAVCGEGEAL